jgi:glycosyltransferase involved in cell wall biosynthesis
VSRPVVLHVAAVEFTASRLLRPQLVYLTEMGYDVRLACTPQGPTFDDDLHMFKPVPIAFPRKRDPVAMTTASLALHRLVRRLRPALVHFHSPAASLPGRMALALDRSRPRVVYTVHGFLHVWDSSSLVDRFVGAAERGLSRWTDALLFQSAEDYDQARALGYRGRLVHLGNGVGDEWFQEGAGAQHRGPLHAIFVGRLTREKGVGELLAAARRLPDVRWTIVGDSLPSDRDALADTVSRFAAESNGSVRWVGMVPPSSVRSYLAEADVLVLPSWREGVPRSIIEGMAGGLPVVATDIRGCRELVEPGVSGWLVPARDASALTAAIRQARDLPRGRLAVMGAEGRKRAWMLNREVDVFNRLSAAYRALGVVP